MMPRLMDTIASAVALAVGFGLLALLYRRYVTDHEERRTP